MTRSNTDSATTPFYGDMLSDMTKMYNMINNKVIN